MITAMAPWVKYALWGLAGLSFAFAAFWLVRTIRRAKDADRLENENAEKDAELDRADLIREAQEEREEDHAERIVDIMRRDSFSRDDVKRMLKEYPEGSESGRAFGLQKDLPPKDS